ncbi:hypothetical protein CH238_05545 [[Clostridium] leptum DSM 753]|uniref:Uncharacterized protein n=1 Tax=[Clostridium] leptum DSM 753 TaxID=428125 RepID=A0A855A6M7_9FIRM|nr:hypothetical protein CH238_05545 [[Clostridium] leptum DSM 753]
MGRAGLESSPLLLKSARALGIITAAPTAPQQKGGRPDMNLQRKSRQERDFPFSRRLFPWRQVPG